jgi:hypothetical protein
MTDAIPQPALDRLVRRLSLLIGTATSALERDPSQVEAWHDEVARQLRRYHLAAYLAGSGASPDVIAPHIISVDVSKQLQFLEQFAAEIQDAAEWKAGWSARAEMYAGSIKTPYWRGVTKLLPLPAMPADGSNQCLTRCGCAWDVQQLDGDNNYDAYWRRSKSDSCQTCVQRSVEWAPLQIRDGVLL